MVVNANFWKSKRVFVTGHTGFKGSWLMTWLISMGAKATGYALAPDTNPSLFKNLHEKLDMNSIIGDIRNLETLSESLRAADPEIVFHLAAQPLVRYSYDNPLETFQTNIIGTANLLLSCRSLKNLKAVVIVTTDKVYENEEWVWAYRENDRLGGYDPYSGSKACTEIVTASLRRSFFAEPDQAAVASARAGNVIGGGDWSLDRIVPDVIRACQNHEVVKLRHPKAVRPWQHVLEPLSGYLLLAQSLYQATSQNKDLFSSAWNFGPDAQNAVTVEELVKLLAKQEPTLKWEVDNGKHPHEAAYLKLESSKAKHHLNWAPRWDALTTAQMTMEWYREFYNNKASALDLCLQQINEYLRN